MAGLVLLPVGILTAAILAQLLLRLLRPTFRSYWLFSAACALILMFAFLYLRVRLPSELRIENWGFGISGSGLSLSWQLNSISMPVGMALAGLLFAWVMVQVRRALTEVWWYWLPGLSLALSALAAIQAGDALALAIGWTLFDITWLTCALLWVRRAEDRYWIYVQLAAGFFSTLALLAARFLVQPAAILDFANLGAASTPWLLLAAGLRLGVLPLNPFLLKRVETGAEAALLLRAFPVAAALPLLAHIAQQRAGNPLWFHVLALLAAFYAAVHLVRAASARGALPYWFLGLSALTLAAAAEGRPAASLASGLALLLGGALLLFIRSRPPLRWLALILGALLLGGLPLTPMHALAGLFTGPSTSVLYLFLLPFALLFFGWLRLAASPAVLDEEAWARAVYTSGFLVLPLLHILFGLGLAPPLAPREMAGLPIWPPLAIWALTAGAFLVARRGPLLPQSIGERVQAFFSLHWLYSGAGKLLSAGGWLMRFLAAILEGRAGVLWALLLVTLLLSVIVQLNVEG